MNPKTQQMIKDIYYMAGLLEGITCLQGQPITEATTHILADCVDRLELMGATLFAEDVKHREEACTEAMFTKDPYQ